ncbi:hypothetical protein CHCC15075_4108 [Bacillus licheniformis]|nr:hypothetical protein MUY_002293 [Bacillus licheniformis WX-02]KYC68626.1 hypothetical protein B4092_2377 [Bacillus licheniformis]TWN16497.1 hypothetical protein CHCC14564_1062 [Bacillus licheniformis LMG 17339]KYC83895.1 hypothetical protein B4091_2474 [Bacillus licheniformis]TWJ66642.1 hypothetical protein CHCC5020_2111 [Bacillus licheniformis]
MSLRPFTNEDDGGNGKRVTFISNKIGKRCAGCIPFFSGSTFG